MLKLSTWFDRVISQRESEKIDNILIIKLDMFVDSVLHGLLIIKAAGASLRKCILRYEKIIKQIHAIVF